MQPVERTEVEGVDYGWVLQTTFVVTIVIGAPIVAALSTLVTLDTWGARAVFAIRVGAPIWFVTAVATAVYAKRTNAGDGNAESTVSISGPDEVGDGGRTDGTGDDAASKRARGDGTAREPRESP